MAGHFSARRGNLEQAVREYQEALRLDPSDSSVRYSLARAYVKMGKSEEAIAQCRTIIARDDSGADRTQTAHAHYLLGNLLNARGEKAEARLHWKEALERTPVDQPQTAGIYDIHAKAEKALRDNR
jgi:tetratricopeptide (TPR) repeat protein